MPGHPGIDIIAPWRTPLRAVESGIIVDVNRNEQGYGRHLRLLGTKTGVYTNLWVYGHCEDIFVNVNDKVEEGQIIATMGNTGFVVSSTPLWEYNPFRGTHLHLGKRKVNVNDNGFSYEGSDIHFTVKDYKHGFYGHIDFRDELEKADTGDTEYRAKQLTAISLLNYLLRNYKHKN